MKYIIFILYFENEGSYWKLTQGRHCVWLQQNTFILTMCMVQFYQILEACSRDIGRLKSHIYFEKPTFVWMPWPRKGATQEEDDRWRMLWDELIFVSNCFVLCSFPFALYTKKKLSRLLYIIKLSKKKRNSQNISWI